MASNISVCSESKENLTKYLKVRVNRDIFRLNITVNDTLFVTSHHHVDQLLEYILGVRRTHCAVLQEVCMQGAIAVWPK